MRKVSPSACRDVAQSGSALEWGSRGRRFKSFHPDQHIKENYPLRELTKVGSLFSFILLSNTFPTYLQLRFSRLRSAHFLFMLLKPRIGIFQRVLHRADNGSRWNPQPFCKPNKGFPPDPGLSLFKTPQPRIVNARLLSQSIAAYAKPFTKRRYNQSHDDFCFIVVHYRMKSIPHSY